MMRDDHPLHSTLLSLDVLPKSGCDETRVYDWPMNEARVAITVSGNGRRIVATIAPDTFPDKASFCNVLTKAEARRECSSACALCVAEQRTSETVVEFCERVDRFCHRICERMVAYEDRFVASFRT